MHIFDDRVSAGGGCETVVRARVRCGWAKFRKCDELLYERLAPNMRQTIYNSYIRTKMLHERK